MFSEYCGAIYPRIDANNVEMIREYCRNNGIDFEEVNKIKLVNRLLGFCLDGLLDDNINLFDFE